MRQPVVSVVMITYGHENYIKKAIEGVLMQKTDFPVELIIANDASPDNTHQIIQSYLNNSYENTTIVYHKHEENIGMMNNFGFAYNQTKGKYIALCEGDDYWTDPLKLQKQVDFLENNPEYTVCVHHVLELKNEAKLHESVFNLSYNSDITIGKLAEANQFHTASVVYRKIFDQLPAWIMECPIGDYPMHLVHAEKGKVHCIAENMAVYRIGSGIWSTETKANRYLMMAKTLNLILENIKDGRIQKGVQDNLYNQSTWFFETQMPTFSSILERKKKRNDYEVGL